MNIFLRLSFLIVNLLFSLTAQAFTNNDFKGRYAFRLVGPSGYVLANLSQTVGTGIITADGNGHVTGQGFFRTAGIDCAGTIIGGYQLNSDGTGVLSSVFRTTTPGCFTGVLDLAMSLANTGKTFVISTTANDYMSGKMIHQDLPAYTLKNLHGNYAISLDGLSSVASAQERPTVGVGLIFADGRGNITGEATLSSFDALCHGRLTGHYQVQANGLGLVATNFITQDLGCFTSVINLHMTLYNTAKGAFISNSENDYLAGELLRQN